VIIDVSEEPTTSVFRVEAAGSPKCCYSTTTEHGVIAKKTTTLKTKCVMCIFQLHSLREVRCPFIANINLLS
jgi:hypothetical protein